MSWTSISGALTFSRRVLAACPFEAARRVVDVSGDGANNSGPPPDIEHHFAELPDGPLTAAQIADVERFAVLAAEAVRAGRLTLVRCHTGLNRSALVGAQALVELGLGVPAAIDRIRQRRSPRALHNRLFVQYLETGLPAARLLAGLDA